MKIEEAYDKKKATSLNSVSMGNNDTPTKASQGYGSANIQIKGMKYLLTLNDVNYYGKCLRLRMNNLYFLSIL